MKLRLLVLLTLVLLSGVSSKASCVPIFSFTTQETDSVTGDPSTGMTLYVNSQVFGSVQMDFNCTRPGVLHTPSVESGITDLTTGQAVGNNMQDGTTVCFDCYISESVTNTMNVNTVDQYEVIHQEAVRCSQVGQFYTSTKTDNHEEAAVTYSQNTHTACGNAVNCVYIVNWCTPESNPADFQPNEAISSNPAVLASPFFNGLTWCTRAKSRPPGSTWNCFTPTLVVLPKSDPALHPCHNWDKGTKGIWP